MKLRHLLLCLLLPWLASVTSAAPTEAEIKKPSISGEAADGKVRLVIEGMFPGAAGEKEKLIFSTAIQESVKVSRDKVSYNIAASLDILQGDPKELTLTLGGEGEIRQ